MSDHRTAGVLARTLVGRDAELGALQAAWQVGGATRFVTAPAGVGKSRLVRELDAWIRERGGLVLVGRCSPTSRDIPLRPVREALLGAARGGLRPDASVGPFFTALARLVPEWGTETSADSELVLSEAILRFLATARFGRPRLLDNLAVSVPG